MSIFQQIFNGGFKPADVPPNEYALIPAGQYGVVIETAEVKPNKAQTGHYLELCLGVLDQYHGRKLFHRFNLDNPSAVASKIALQDLGKLCEMLGISNLTAESQLVGGRVTARVIVDGEYNAIKGWQVATTPATQPSTTSAGPTNQPIRTDSPPVNQPSPSTVQVPPWARRSTTSSVQEIPF